MIVIDEYLAVRVVGGPWPDGLADDDDLALTASRHWRLLQRIHAPGTGQLSRVLAGLSPAGRDAVRHPHPEVLHVLDPRPLLDEAAVLAAATCGSGWNGTSASPWPGPPASWASPSTSSPPD